jgi:hypothetical protein
MKKTITTAFILMIFITGSAQDVNWKSINQSRMNLGHFRFGYNYGTVAQFGYGRLMNLYKPLLFTADFSMPMGENLFDDFKLRYGGQVNIYEKNNFVVAGKILGNFRRIETSMVRIAGFGAELSAIAGYYKSTWHIAGELGFDKAISSHAKHSDEMRNNAYTEINDGWYVPTGGNWHYGIQGSKSIGQTYDFTLRLGATTAQGNDEDALLPFYLSIGVNKRF